MKLVKLQATFKVEKYQFHSVLLLYSKNIFSTTDRIQSNFFRFDSELISTSDLLLTC